MTSNIGADLIKGGGGFGFQKRSTEVDYGNIKGILMKEIERFFRPEFINRLDEVIVFRPLGRADLVNIVELEVGKVAERLSHQGITLSLDDKAKEFLIEKGYNPDFGARPLRRSIGHYIEDPLSEMLLSSEFKPPCTVKITHKPDGDDPKSPDHLFFETVPAPAEPSAEERKKKKEAAGQSST